MATMKELRDLATDHDIKGRSKMDHLELTAALEAAGAEVPPPDVALSGSSDMVRVEWRRQWEYVVKNGKRVRKKVDGEWELVREVNRSEAQELVETAETVWPNGETRVVEE